MTPSLKGSVKKYLRGLAHNLRPVVAIGKEGLTEGVYNAIDIALDAQELLKVQIKAAKEDRKKFAAAIEERMKCECVGAIGYMAIFYRQQPDPEKRGITLPE